MDGTPYEPTSPPKPSTRGRDDMPPPAPPHELRRGIAPERQLTVGAEAWIAWLGGKGACGTGSYGLGLVEAVHFARADAPDRPLREALLPRGRFEALFDAELLELFERATPVVGS